MTCNTGYERFQNAMGAKPFISPSDYYAVASLYGKNPPPMFDVSVMAEGPGECVLTISGFDGKTVDAALLDKSFGGTPVPLSAASQTGKFAGWTSVPGGCVTFSDPSSPATEAVWNSGGTAKAVFTRTTLTGTIGSVFTLKAAETLGTTGSFPVKPVVTVEGRKAKTVSSNSSLIVFEWNDSKVPAGTHPISILSGKTTMDPACDLVLVPPQPKTAAASGTTVTVEGSHFGKMPTAAIGGRKLSSKTVFDPGTGASRTTIKNPKMLTGTVTITNKLGAGSIDL